MYIIYYHFKHCKSYITCSLSARDRLLFDLNKKMLKNNKDIVIDYTIVEY